MGTLDERLYIYINVSKLEASFLAFLRTYHLEWIALTCTKVFDHWTQHTLIGLYRHFYSRHDRYQPLSWAVNMKSLD